MGRHFSPRYGQVILVSGFPDLTAVKAGADGIEMSKVIKGSTYETPKQSRRHGCGKPLVC